MIDFRHQTFLALCKIKSFTKTADFLHITQPAVSQHIKYLEVLYGHKLFDYNGKALFLTEYGLLLNRLTMSMQANSLKIKEEMTRADLSKYPINFGATLTIGEFVMSPIISNMLKNNDKLELTMLVDNTQVLLKKLEEGLLDFVILEGFFDKSLFDYQLFKTESFIPICSSNSVLKKGSFIISDLYNERLILREKGSGTRAILEQILHEQNQTLNSFNNHIQVGNINVIKQLVQQNLGISFLYKSAVENELKLNELVEIKIEALTVTREFNFVFLKNSLHRDEYLSLFEMFGLFDNRNKIKT